MSQSSSTDPRNKRFYQLQKRDLCQLSISELNELLAFTEKMIDFVKDSKSRRSWTDFETEIRTKLNSNA